MKIRVLLTVILLLASILATGCFKSTSFTPAAETMESSRTCNAGDLAAAPAVYGLWVKEEDSNQGPARDLLAVTENSIYLVENTGGKGNGSLRETFFEITGVDWVNGVITMSAKWVRVNGNYGGFDYPLRYLKISIDGDALYFSVGDEGQGIPSTAENGPWMRK